MKPIVVVWELETLVLFHSLVLGSLDVHANRKAEGSDDNNGDGDDDGDRKKQRLMYMGLAMERLVFHVADKLLVRTSASPSALPLLLLPPLTRCSRLVGLAPVALPRARGDTRPRYHRVASAV